MKMSFAFFSLALPLALPQTSYAGMGAVFPKYHPAPCEGGACKGDDPHSGMPCQGLLCTFSSAKSLQPPVTGSPAVAPAPVAEAATPAETPAVADAKPKKRKAAAKRSKAREAKSDRAPPVAVPAKTDSALAR